MMHTLTRPSILLNLIIHCRPRIRTPYTPLARSISSTCAAQSGHSRWSKIKHDKARVDAGRSKGRSYISRSIKEASKHGGPDPRTNPRLAAMIVEAKKNDFPKASIEKAIARGQGLSSTGAPLESFTLEFMLPPAVAGILEIETDSRARTLQDLKHIMKEQGGTVTPCAYMFDRRGRVMFAPESGVSEEQVLEHAIEAGALDVENELDGEFVVWTAPEDMATVAEALSGALGTAAKSQDLVYVPKDDARTDDGGQELTALLGRLDNLPEIQEMYLNTA